jgi:hypothetical protein
MIGISIGKKMNFRILCLVLVFLITASVRSQVKGWGVGIFFGAGSISGNLPSQTSFAAGVTLDFEPSFTEGLPLRLGAVYARKFEVLLPSGLQGKYYPFVKGIYLKGVLQQPLGKMGYLEEALGPLLLNDRTFNDVDAFDIGAVFSLLIGLDFTDFEDSGFKTGLGLEYGTTFTNTTAQYSSVYLQGQYFF